MECTPSKPAQLLLLFNLLLVWSICVEIPKNGMVQIFSIVNNKIRRVYTCIILRVSENFPVEKTVPFHLSTKS